MSASTQSSSRPWTRTCSTSSTSTLRSANAPNNLFGEARTVLPAHRDEIR